MTAALEETVEDLARAFATSRTPQDRERLCEAALPMVRRLATAVLRRLPAHFVADDLVGDGCLGLLRAVDRFDPSHGIAFEIWAARIVRGAMLNGLRRMDVIPERVRRDARNLDQARWQLAQHGGESPSDAAAAAGAGLSERKLNAVLLALRRAVPLSLDAPVGISDQGSALGERIESETADPAQIVAQRSLNAVLARAVTTLSARERLIIASFYAGETTFRAIGGRLGISKQRVSQIHGRAIASLRAMLALAAVDA